MALLIVLVIVVLTLVISYNRLVRAKNTVQEAWSGIDIQLKRRHDLLPKLVDIVKGYQQHERNTQLDIAQLRSRLGSGDIAAIGQGENSVSRRMRGLLALAEAYPELKANQNFASLSQSVSEVEDVLQKARRYYNGAVRDNNVLVESIPSGWLARPLGFKTFPFFELESIAERESTVPKF